MGETPLHQAIAAFSVRIAQMLLEFQADPNIQQNDGDTPLHQAVFKGNNEVTELLLKHNADPNIVNKCFGRSPLHNAVEYGSFEVVELLIRHGANPDIEDKSGLWPLDLCKDSEIARLFDDLTLLFSSSRRNKDSSFSGLSFSSLGDSPDPEDQENRMSRYSIQHTKIKGLRSSDSQCEPDAERTGCERSQKDSVSARKLVLLN